MEITSKKSKPNFNTHYPSEEEIQYLLENEQYDTLRKRLNEKTVENVMKDYIARQNINEIKNMSLDINIIRKILIQTDIRSILTLSSKVPIFARILVDDTFWEKKICV